MIRKEKRATWRYVMSGSWPLILSQDLQLWMTVRWWGSSQAFTLSVAHTLKNDTDYSWAEVFFLSEYLCSAVSFHNIPPFFTFWFLVPIFFWATPLEYRLPSISLIFPIESKRRCRDSTHCFHLCNTAMISPAVACQPRLFHSRKTSSTEKLLLITTLYSNYSSLGTALSPGMGTGSRRGENESGMSATHLPGVTERTFGWEGLVSDGSLSTPGFGLDQNYSELLWGFSVTLRHHGQSNLKMHYCNTTKKKKYYKKKHYVSVEVPLNFLCNNWINIRFIYHSPLI